MRAIKYNKDTVLIKDSNIKAWVDIWIENEDVICDWQQNHFIMTNPKEVALKNWQDKLTNFEKAISARSRSVLALAQSFIDFPSYCQKSAVLPVKGGQAVSV